MKLKLAVAAFVFFGLVLVGVVLVITAGTDTAKKLVGVWEVTKESGKPPKDKGILEYTADGKYSLDGQKGTYIVKGDMVARTFKVGEDEFFITEKINKLTETELHTRVVSTDAISLFPVEMEYKRVKK